MMASQNFQSTNIIVFYKNFNRLKIKPIFIPVFLSAAILVSAIQFRNF